MRLSILVFDGFTALDAVGGYEVLQWIPGLEVEFVGKESGIYAADGGRLGLLAYRSLEEAKGCDILYVPGGPGGFVAQRDPEILGFIRNAHDSSKWTVGICNGVEILARAGVLEGVEVTTNYNCREIVADLGATVLPRRYHRDGKIITGAGVSASIDTGLFLADIIAGREAAEAIQFGIEYYPDPPFGPKVADEASDRAKCAVAGFERNFEAVLASRAPPFSAIGISGSS